MNFAKSLWKHDHKEIGLQSVQRKVSPFSKSGMTWTVLNRSEKTPVVMDRLIRCVNGFMTCSMDND